MTSYSEDDPPIFPLLIGFPTARPLLIDVVSTKNAIDVKNDKYAICNEMNISSKRELKYVLTTITSMFC